MEIDGIHVHQSITLDVVIEAVKRGMSSVDNPGFCIACGEEVEGVEPDARKYECDFCGEDAVYGADEIAINWVV